eukprot:3462325-Alexandrium_andersonii.AAC.1
MGFFEVFASLANASVADLFHRFPAATSSAQRLKCVSEFESGRGHLSFVYTLKLAYCLEPPFLLCA